MKSVITRLSLLGGAFAGLVALASAPAFAQTTNDSPPSQVLDDGVFDRMIIQHISYAITGENTPVTGIKVDLSKPEATISGVFPLVEDGWLLFGFDLKGGVTDKSFSILKGYSQLNTAFEFRPSIHLMPAFSKAKFHPSKVPLVIAKNELVRKEIEALEDTCHVWKAIYSAHLRHFPELQDKVSISELNLRQVKLLLNIMRDVLKVDTTKLTECSPEEEIQKKIPAAVPKEEDKTQIQSSSLSLRIIDMKKKYDGRYEKRDDEKSNRMIANSADVWTVIKLRWLSFQPFLRSEQLTSYSMKYKDRDSSHFKKDHPFHFGFGVTYNRYNIHSRGFATFLRGTVAVMKTYNTATLSSFNYQTRREFFTNGNGITEKTESGLAYNKSDIKSGFVKQFSLEGFLLPLRSFVPGLYASTNINIGDLYHLPKVESREKDDTQIALEGGLVFNIANKEKDKQNTLLSVLLFGRFEDVTDSRRTEIETKKRETEDEFLTRNLSFGLRVGIPINLPKKAG